MKIFGWSAGQDGCEWYRLRLPLETLRERGHLTCWHEKSATRDAEGNLTILGKLHPWADHPEVLIGQRIANPNPSLQWQKICRERDDIHTVYELDDDLLNVDETNPAAAFYSQPAIQDNIRANIAMADRVTVSTPELADAVSMYAKDVRVIPNGIPAELLSWSPLEMTLRKRDDFELTIGWSGSGTHHMDWDYEKMDRHMGKILRGHHEVEFHTIGWDYGKRVSAADQQKRHTPWVKVGMPFYKAIDFDIGIAPLRPHPFNQAKSYIKALEYGALGIPVIASAYGPYVRYVRHGVSGFLVHHEHEWPRYLRALVENDALRTSMGIAARKQASTMTVNHYADLWEEALTKW